MKDILESVYSTLDMQAKNRVIAILADVKDRETPNDRGKSLASIIQEALMGRHFDKMSAEQRVSRIYYISEEGMTIHAPFISEAKSNELYEEYKKHIAGYNAHDFYVVLNNTQEHF